MRAGHLACVALTAFSVLVYAVGCGGSADADLCEKVAECGALSQDACEEGAARSREAIEENGCIAEYDALIECRLATPDPECTLAGETLCPTENEAFETCIFQSGLPDAGT